MTETVSSFKTLVDLLSIEVTLTQEGALKSTYVLSLINAYIRKAVTWMTKVLPVFTET